MYFRKTVAFLYRICSRKRVRFEVLQGIDTVVAVADSGRIAVSSRETEIRLSGVRIMPSGNVS